MGIVKVQPDKKRSLLMTTQPAESAISNVFCAPLNALVAVFSWLALVKMPVIQIEAAIEAGSGGGRIEDISSEERRSVIAVMMQQIGQIWEILAKPRAEPRNPMRSARVVSRVIRMMLGGLALGD